jgi:FXSXX-COOH protein
MSNDPDDAQVDVDLQALSPTCLADLGDSVLGYAIRRIMTTGADDGTTVTIAAFQDSV